MTEKKKKIPCLSKGFITDEKKELEGEIVVLSNGMICKIARWNNKEHRKLVMSLRRPYMSHNGKAKPSFTEEVQNNLMAESMAKTILLGWKEKEKDEFYYDYETAKEDLQTMDLLLEIFEISQDRANFLAEEKKADVKNS